MLKKLLCIIAAVAVTLPASGCKNKDTASSEASVQPDTSASSEITAAPAEKPTESPYIGINPLTGEGGYNTDAYGKRPVAVMVNNLKDSLPQYGIEQADIIYELPVEGGITRLMAVYADYTNVPDICSVRSCRYYYPLLCLGMDAVYCHWGADQTIALDTLNRTGIDHIDGGYEKTLFYRDEERVGKYASEHTGYLKGSELPEKIAEKGFRTDIDELYSGTIFNFADESVEIVSTEMTAKRLMFGFRRLITAPLPTAKKRALI